MTDDSVRPDRRQRSLHCKPAEQAMIRERAAAAEKTVSRYVMELALADDPDRHPLVLTEEEQVELRDGVLEIQAFVRALRRELPGGSGLSFERDLGPCRGAGAVKRGRRRRRKPVSKHISISATDADWEVVRSHANRRGLSIARYLVELVERDGSEEDTGLRHECPGVALAAEEQREQLEAMREIRALMLEGEEAGPRHECLRHECLVRDMQERIAVMFAAWASAMAKSGPRARAACGAHPGAWREAGAHCGNLGRDPGRGLNRSLD